MGTGRMTATNTFTKGMLMDFDPLMSMEGGGMWTNALNGTLLTFNGNEKMMQPDMGNGRVETAYLPEGYVPLGTCEYGDIIYIVSYNPLENKCQLGCFPSPERNISSDEISDMQQSITIGDFQKINSYGTPTGKLVGTSTKKILYDNENMYPGDKYIIYEESGTSNTDSDNLSANGNTLSDFGNISHKHNKWPKLLKINVVSIEDSGRITNMNTSIKWYTWQSLDYNDDGTIKEGTIYDPETDDYIEINKTIDHDFYINRMHSESASGIDLDSYRDLISSPYSVYSSKISGKLALLVEVEEIDSFSCTFEVYTTACNSSGVAVESEEPEYTKYDIYFYTSWESSHNDINPIGFIFTESNWINLNSEGENIKVGGVIGIPTNNESKTGDYYYDYNQDENNTPKIEKLPISKDDIAENGYDYDKVFQYSRTYKLEDPPETYKEYLEKNYDSKIDDICDWYKTGEGDKVIYETIKNADDQDKYKYLPVVSTIHREINEGGRPYDYADREDIHEAAEYKYYYNLKVVELPDGLSDPSYDNYKYYTITNNGYKVELSPVTLKDDVVNNYFKKDIPTLVASPIYQTSKIVKNTDNTSTKISTDLSNLVWQYKVAPAMPYGVLDWLTLDGNIDFSKVGSGEITLTDWRYYNTTSQCTLTWGLECYPEPNKGIAEVVLDFYDNQGLACSMHIKGKSSYSGTFTETFDFGTRYSSYNMSSINADGDTFVHAGNAVDSPSVDSEYVFVGTGENSTLKCGKAYSGICKSITNTESTESKIKADINRGDGTVAENITAVSTISRTTTGGVYGPYYDDSGTIYTSMLYAVKITVKYTTKNILGDYDDEVNQEEFKVFYRWLWTNNIFNDNYYSIKDFDVLSPQIGLDFTAQFDSFAHTDSNKKVVNNALSSDLKVYWDNTCNEHTEEGAYRSLGAVITTVGDQGITSKDIPNADDEVGNILMSFSPSLQDTYNDSFTLAIPAGYYDVSNKNTSNTTINAITYEEFKIDIIPGQAKIALNPEQPSVTNNAGSSVVSVSTTDAMLMPQIIDSYEQTGTKKYGYATKHTETEVGNSLGPECQTLITGSNGGSEADEIWASGTTYQNYKDCFSLTMVDKSSGSVKSTDDIHVYTDSLGTTYQLTGHNIYSTTMAAAYTQYTKESGDKSDYTGVQLNLQGYHFSKVCVGNWKASTNASLLVSVLEAGLVPEINADSEGNAYFIESATHVTCRSQECKKCTRDSKILKFDSSSETHNWYSSSSDAWSNMKRVNGYANESKTSEITAEFNDFYPYLSALMSNSNIFPIFFGGCETASQWGTNYVRSDDDSSYTNIKEIFIETNADKGDGMHPFNRDTGSVPYFTSTFNNSVYRKATWYTVGIKTQSGGMIILPFFWLGALFSGSSSTGGSTTVSYPTNPKSSSLDKSSSRNSQVFACKNSNRTCIDGDGSSSSVTARAWPKDLGSCRTFADVFASFFSQLYVVGGTSSDTYYNPEYEFYCSSYTESWSQDLVVHLYFNGEINNYLILHSMLLSDYIAQLYNNCDDSNLKNTINTNNTEIDVAEVCRVIEFQYNVAYSPNNLLSTIMAMNNVSEPQINVFGGTTVTANMEGSPSKNKFYVISSWADYESSVAVTNLKSTSTLYYVGGLYTNKKDGDDIVGVTGKYTVNEWVNEYSDSARKFKVPTGVVNTILNNIGYDGDQILYNFENPSSYWTYLAKWHEGWLKIKNIPSFNLTGDTLM